MTALHRLWGLATIALAAISTASAAQAPGFTALRSVEGGQWRLSEAGGRVRTICIADVSTLFQLRSRRSGECARMVIENEATSAVVQYSCPNVGHGRTAIAVETPRLLHIESQGIHRGVPFDFDIEARREGACSRSAVLRPRRR